MKISATLPAAFACLLWCAGAARADPVWSTGRTLMEVIGFDLQSHDAGAKLTDDQTNAVCLLLGYLRGFAQSAAIASHYDATALPFVLPSDINNDEIERVIYKFLSDNRDELDKDGAALVVAALSRQYPNPSFSRILNPKGLR